ncbi:hypothetical protein F5B20DRAFT_352752 [Whalleya microplaca]|nr:hypothetical protein F5B20DRAFT_352752 [Whalleya microplaca]
MSGIFSFLVYLLRLGAHQRLRSSYMCSIYSPASKVAEHITQNGAERSRAEQSRDSEHQICTGEIYLYGYTGSYLFYTWVFISKTLYVLNTLWNRVKPYK